MNKLSADRQTQIAKCLIEGSSIRATCRMTGADKGTVLGLLANLGEACKAYHDEHVRGFESKRIQVDELWSFCGMKEKNVPAEIKGRFGLGDVWTFTALDPDSKLIVNWLVGKRDAQAATNFLLDLQARLTNRVQLSTDGHRMYLQAVEEVFGADVDFGQVQKIFTHLKADRPETRYSPGQCCGIKKKRIEGNPATNHISTSLVERNNLTIRMQNRRFTRLTNAFSKKVENHEHSLALHFMAYNFTKIHGTLGMSPAMASGVTDRLWDVEDIVGLLDGREWAGRERTN